MATYQQSGLEIDNTLFADNIHEDLECLDVARIFRVYSRLHSGNLERVEQYDCTLCQCENTRAVGGLTL